MYRTRRTEWIQLRLDQSCLDTSRLSGKDVRMASRTPTFSEAVRGRRRTAADIVQRLTGSQGWMPDLPTPVWRRFIDHSNGYGRMDGEGRHPIRSTANHQVLAGRTPLTRIAGLPTGYPVGESWVMSGAGSRLPYRYHTAGGQPCGTYDSDDWRPARVMSLTICCLAGV